MEHGSCLAEWNMLCKSISPKWARNLS